MINEIALILLLGLFGWKIALMYVVSGLLIAILAGIITNFLNVEDLVNQSIRNQLVSPINQKQTFMQRVHYAKSYTVNTLSQIWPYIVLGVGVGAWIHGFVPTDFIARYAGGTSWYTVPLATLIGIPLYSNAAGVMPLVSVLTQKGVSIGTTLAFMMAVTGLSLPEFLILKKVMKTKLIIIFATTVGIGILITGYLFNFLLR
jgi:hypothetical protein